MNVLKALGSGLVSVVVVVGGLAGGVYTIFGLVPQSEGWMAVANGVLGLAIFGAGLAMVLIIGDAVRDWEARYAPASPSKKVAPAAGSSKEDRA